MIGRPLTDRAQKRGFTSNDKFRSSFNKLLQGRAKQKNIKGVDNARGLGQAIAKVKGRNNKQRTKPMNFVNPVAAALQHSVRNRSVEQGANRATRTTPVGAALNASANIRRVRGT